MVSAIIVVLYLMFSLGVVRGVNSIKPQAKVFNVVAFITMPVLLVCFFIILSFVSSESVSKIINNFNPSKE